MNDVKKEQTGTTPIPVSIKLSGCALTINAKCGGCKHFNRIPHTTYGVVCKVKGILETSKPCSKFAPDPRQLDIRNSEHLQALALILEGIPDDMLPLVSTLVNQEHLTRKRGFSLGQSVYLRPFGGDYISNYRQARVISADRKLVHVQTSDGAIASVFFKSVLTPRQWMRKRKELESQKRIKDPNYKRYFKNASKAEQELKKFLNTNVAPTLDRTDLTYKVFEAVEKKKKGWKALHTTDVSELLKVR